MIILNLIYLFLVIFILFFKVYSSCTEVAAILDVTLPTNDSVLMTGPSHKRRRIEPNFEAVLDQLVDLSVQKEPVCMWPW